MSVKAAPPAASDASARAVEIANLLGRVGLGDRAAFATLYQQTSSHLLGVIQRITGNRESAQDILQEVYVNVWRSAAVFDARLSQPATWLTSVARNRAIDSLRRRQTQPKVISANLASTVDGEERDLLDEFASDDAGPLQAMEQAQEAQAVRRCIKVLSKEQQQSVALAFYQGHSYAEVAEHLHQPLGTVKSWVRRGLLSLKDCLERSASRG